MKLDSVARNLRVLWRADAIIAQLQLQHMLTRFGLRAFAALIATFGLLGLELGAYFMLVQRLDAAPAAILLGAANVCYRVRYRARLKPHAAQSGYAGCP